MLRDYTSSYTINVASNKKTECARNLERNLGRKYAGRVAKNYS